MGCAGSKNADAVLEGTAAADSLRPAASADDVQLKAKSKSSLRKKSKSSNREAETVSAEPEPEPEPPEPPKPCAEFRPYMSSMMATDKLCTELPEGWLKAEVDGRTYYFNCETGASSWEAPEGAGKGEGGDAVCSGCGCLRTHHAVCQEWNPREDKPTECQCGFTKSMHTACSNYRVNVAAENFGDCKCGFPKDQHEVAAFQGGSKAAKKKGADELRATFQQKGYCPCTVYRVNLASANFGECMCGEPKAAHSPEALAGNADAGKAQGGKKQDSEELRKQFAQKDKVSCKRYEPDLSAADFGVCVCGAKRADHTAEALQAGTGTDHTAAAKRADADVRAGFVQKQFVQCERYVVNMDPSVPFGQCICGAAKAEHTQDALTADTGGGMGKKRNSAEVRADMEKHAAEVGVSVEASGQKTDVAFGVGNTVTTAAEEEAKMAAAMKARAGGGEQLGALKALNDAMGDAVPGAPAAA